ncbi:methyltransferase domain-containing protein [Sinorhizobium meliloti]|uniref:class I SAM-dependent methyltransferase n=1 Tax=Rhizobium meliloti TaxID=382 RepID=UPI00237EF29B|nr:methyltransferase domain-containing protein [Sinorhizobium meliloti]MDE3814297.1 methyltransferase domain-containing protein [Sinorhizobium meliloti]
MDFRAAFTEIAAEAMKDDIKFADFVDAYRAFLVDVEDAVLPPQVTRRGIEHFGGAQSKQFMVQLLPTIQQYMRKFPQKTHFSILDVGPGAAFGSNLLASMYQTPFLGYTATVHTTDIIDHYIKFAKVFCPNVVTHQADIYDVAKSYDIVIASHVIEHVPKWRSFVKRLKELSRGIAIVCSPYRENPEMLTRGHCNIFDDEMLEEMKPEHVQLTESPAWGQFMKPPYKMFIATLKGESTYTHAI